jgi:hypothetical protein
MAITPADVRKAGSEVPGCGSTGSPTPGAASTITEATMPISANIRLQCVPHIGSTWCKSADMQQPAATKNLKWDLVGLPSSLQQPWHFDWCYTRACIPCHARTVHRCGYGKHVRDSAVLVDGQWGAADCSHQNDQGRLWPGRGAALDARDVRQVHDRACTHCTSHRTGSDISQPGSGQWLRSPHPIY